MKTGQVLDAFTSRGKCVCTMWDLDKGQRFTVRLRATAKVDLGDILLFADSRQVRRLSPDDLDKDQSARLILPVPVGDETVVLQQDAMEA